MRPFPPSDARAAASQRLRCAVLACCLALVLTPWAGAALTTPSPGGVNLITSNPGFEQAASSTDNLWDGVDSDGNLAGFNYSSWVSTESGPFGGLAMPPSVAFADLNGDGKPDLITADPTGVFRFYPNSGTATAPKFTSAELMPIFISNGPYPHPDNASNFPQDDVRYCPRFALADWRHPGLLDMIVGNYMGEIFFLPNIGTARQPAFFTGGNVGKVYKTSDEWPRGAHEREQNDLDKIRIPTNDQGRLWANLLTPVAYDWNGDGKLDLICGEGTYSANAIHLLQNSGGEVPKFTSAGHTRIAYGDGREQLIPTIADFNGDGFPDLIVADRTGEVSVYLSAGKPKPGVELKRTSTITFGGASKLPGLCSLFAADYNGDGLFDLIIGLPNGHIAVALNTGTKTDPKFDPIQEIKGTDRLGRNLKTPPGWNLETWTRYGNVLSYFTVVNAQDDPESKPPEGTQCLKAGYWPMPAQTFPLPAEGLPGQDRHFTVTRDGLTLNVNKRYHVSFKIKNLGMEKMHWRFHSLFLGFPSLAKIERGERGEAKRNQNWIFEDVDPGQDFNAGEDWTQIEGDVTPRYKNPALQDRKQMSASFNVEFWARNLASVAYLDDFHITEAK